MKAERRHELQTNWLADHLGKYFEQIRPHVQSIALAVVAVCALGLAYLYFAGQQTASSGRSWAAFQAALAGNDAESLVLVTENYPGTEASFWSLQMIADMELGRGVGLLYRDREEAESAIQNARKNYEIVMNNAQQGSLLQTRARFGLAQAFESLNELDDAKRLYRLVASSQANSALGEEAQRCLDRLSDESTEQWYTWFASQEPRLPPIAGHESVPGRRPGQAGSGPPPFFGGGLDLPGDLTDLPDRPDLSFPGSDDPQPGDDGGEESSADESTSAAAPEETSTEDATDSPEDGADASADGDETDSTAAEPNTPKPPAPDRDTSDKSTGDEQE